MKYAPIMENTSINMGTGKTRGPGLSQSTSSLLACPEDGSKLMANMEQSTQQERVYAACDMHSNDKLTAATPQ